MVNALFYVVADENVALECRCGLWEYIVQGFLLGRIMSDLITR
jgi:hypothetical protein